MKIGVLICDDVSPALELEHGNYKAMFSRLLLAVDKTLELKFYWLNHNEFPDELTECDAYMTTGSKSGIMDDDAWIIRMEDLVRQIHLAQIPFVGICFGHQMLAKALGGEVYRAKVGWGIGTVIAKVYKPQVWMKPYQNKFNLLVSHQDQVLRIPDNAQAIAGNDFCPVSMMQVGQTSLGIQAHPEFCVAYSKALIEKRKDSIPENVQKRGFTSLKLPTDGQLVACWMLNFIRMGLKLGKKNIKRST
ncbi:GMP synthase [Vibrio sp. Isolate32]|uniref:glutamine amidotransferase-related protein n=1 Tax=Vibrio sp. Isolate32 TaxID=2908538 RepID=UPI001EFCF141|nr:GMP synthase [Vibrio sp. Isolate32]MCG9552903.1 GMP synthase [Vibrio sp. Isolate32]